MLDETMAAPLIETVNGKQVTFRRLLNEDYGALEAAVRQLRRSHIKRLADECKLQGTDRFVALRDHDTPWVTEAQVFAYLCTYDGAKKAVGMSLSASGASEDQIKEILAAYQFSDLANLATTLIGFTERRPTHSESTEKAVALENPTATPAESE